MAETTPPLLLYDGTCGFCSDVVRFILGRDRVGTLRFAPLDGIAGRSVLARHPELHDVDSVLWVDDASGVLARSDAALRIARYLGGRWRLALAARILPRPWRDAAYDLIARHRHRLTRDGQVCLFPSPAERTRFLD